MTRFVAVETRVCPIPRTPSMANVEEATAEMAQIPQRENQRSSLKEGTGWGEVTEIEGQCGQERVASETEALRFVGPALAGVGVDAEAGVTRSC